MLSILLTWSIYGLMQLLQATQDPTTAQSAASDKAAPAPPADKSLSLNELLAAGLPAHDRNWTSNDVRTAAQVLTAIARKDATQLPRYESTRSGRAFERITADANLEIYRSKTLPLSQRLPAALETLNSLNQVLKLYLDAFNREKVGDSEIIELLGTQLRCTVVMLSLAEEFLPTLDSKDPTYPVRLEGLKKMKGGMAEVVFGTLVTLTESHAYRLSERRRLVGHMQSTFPKILPALLEDSRSEVLQRIRDYAKDARLQELRPDIEKLLMAVKEPQ